MAKPSKPVSAGGKTTSPKKVETVGKTETSKPVVAKKPVSDAKPTTARAAKTASSATSRASAAAKPKADAVKKVDVAKSDKPADAPKSVEIKSETKVPLVKETAPKPDEKKPEPAAPPTPAPAPEKTGTGFVPLVLGGVIAAALGFVASEANLLGWRTQDDSLRVTLSEQQDQIEALMSAQSPADLSAIEGSLAGLNEQIAALDTRIAEVENRPATTVSVETGEPVEDVRAELAAMQAAINAQRDEIESLLGNAKSVEKATAASARIAAGQRALAQVTSAIGNGSSFADSIDEMTAAGFTDLPAALTEPAQEGVVTLNNLQSRFPDVARAVLADARASTTDSENNGIGGFLRRQLGARSVTSREGNDPDAILSRAEGAVRDGRVAEALAEINALPDGLKDAMQGWLSDARVRADAEAAVQDLSQRLTAN